MYEIMTLTLMQIFQNNPSLVTSSYSLCPVTLLDLFSALCEPQVHRQGGQHRRRRVAQSGRDV